MADPVILHRWSYIYEIAAGPAASALVIGLAALGATGFAYARAHCPAEPPMAFGCVSGDRPQH